MALRRTRAGTADRTAPADHEPGRGERAVVAGRNTTGSGLLLVARVVRFVTLVIVGIIVVAILLRVFGANAGNTVVKDVHDAGKALVGPFKNMFNFDNAKTAIAVNWGIAAALYLLVGMFIARLVARAAIATRV
jgi:hypothetical protein